MSRFQMFLSISTGFQRLKLGVTYRFQNLLAISTWFKRLKSRCDEPLSNFASNSNFRRYVKDMSRELKIQSEEGLDAKLEALEYQMSHESLTVLQQKAILREVKILKATRSDIVSLSDKRAQVAGVKGEKDELYAAWTHTPRHETLSAGKHCVDDGTSVTKRLRLR
jgi:hypothetical protein